jgi:hypothetical protein
VGSRSQLCWVTSDKSLNLFVPQFSKSNSFVGSLWRWSEATWRLWGRAWHWRSVNVGEFSLPPQRKPQAKRTSSISSRWGVPGEDNLSVR